MDPRKNFNYYVIDGSHKESSNHREIQPFDIEDWNCHRMV